MLVAETDANGSFTIDKAPARTYRVCVTVSGFLDPCAWPSQFSPVSFTVGGSQLPLKVYLARGVQVRVRLASAVSNLPTESSVGRNSPAWSAVHDARGVLLSHLTLAAREANFHDYVGLVPLDASLQLGIHSSTLTLQDSTGRTGSAIGLFVPMPTARPRMDLEPLGVVTFDERLVLVNAKP